MMQRQLHLLVYLISYWPVPYLPTMSCWRPTRFPFCPQEQHEEELQARLRARLDEHRQMQQQQQLMTSEAEELRQRIRRDLDLKVIVTSYIFADIFACRLRAHILKK